MKMYQFKTGYKKIKMSYLYIGKFADFLQLQSSNEGVSHGV
jgi:hypothetical protein